MSLPPPLQYQPCPHCGFRLVEIPPSCPQCKFVFYTPPLTPKQILWNKIGLFAWTVPSHTLVVIPLAWIGATFIDLLSAGTKIETGGNLSEHAEKIFVRVVIIVLILLGSWLVHSLILRRPHVRKLLQSDPDSTETTRRWIAIEAASITVIEIIVVLLLPS